MKNIENLYKSASFAETKLKSLANSNRLMLLCLLQDEPKDVSSLVSASGLSQSVVSQHLAKLKEADVVTPEKEGKSIIYKITDPVTLAILSSLYLAYCYPN